MIASTLPQVSLWVENSTKLSFSPYDLPSNYHESVHNYFARAIKELLPEVSIKADPYKRIILKQSKPFSNKDIATVIATMLYVLGISISLPGINWDIDGLPEYKKLSVNDDMYKLVRQALYGIHQLNWQALHSLKQ